MQTKTIVWKARDQAVLEKHLRKSPDDLLNEWLNNNKGIHIQHITQSETGSVIANHRITYTIWYEE